MRLGSALLGRTDHKPRLNKTLACADETTDRGFRLNSRKPEKKERRVYAPTNDCGKSDGIVPSAIGICFWREWRQSQSQRNDQYPDRRNLDCEVRGWKHYRGPHR